MSEVINTLFVDDDEDFRTSLTAELTRKGLMVFPAESGLQALELLKTHDIGVALVDIRMPQISGLELLGRIKEKSPDTEVIMLTGFGTIDSAIEAMKAGACDFIRKPCKLNEIEMAIRKAFEKKTLKKQNVLFKNELKRESQYPEIIGTSSKLQKVLEIVEKVAPLDSTVLILGESGVGKGLVAKAIHRNSSRAAEPFIVMDCCSLNENLLQSELFGHEKGAYTGATQLKHGLFEVADGGTLFLDEIGEISPAIQTGLLRVLETGLFRRVGGLKDVNVDVRILAATNRDLGNAIRNGQFREDLYYRLNVIAVTVPPLRERKEDIPLLVEHALKSPRFPQAARKKMSPEALDVLTAYHWPGNIRELMNVMERAIILSDNDLIHVEDLPLHQPQSAFSFKSGETIKSLAQIQNDYIAWVLQKTGHNQKKACQLLGIDPKTLYRKLKKKE